MQFCYMRSHKGQEIPTSSHTLRVKQQFLTTCTLDSGHRWHLGHSGLEAILRLYKLSIIGIKFLTSLEQVIFIFGGICIAHKAL
ncbi:hypothetical protein V6Z11_D10G090800 [Gossypium hirsutum]